MNMKINQALRYAQMGWYVFPVHYIINGRCSCNDKNCKKWGKHPVTPHGFKDATRDPEQIKQLWAPSQDWNIGIAVGPDSNLSVMDVDPRNGGDESFKALIAEYGLLPVTPIAKSGGGGWHAYFLYNNQFAIPKKYKKGIDVKNNGYIIAPPSNHVSGGCYEWYERHSPWDVPCAEVPDWLQSAPTQHEAPDVDGNSMEHLTKLSGAEELKGEVINFKLNSNGTHQIIVNGNSTSCWIDENGYIGSHDKGGPTVIQWIEWHEHSTKEAHNIAKKYGIELPSQHEVVEDVEVLPTRLFPVIDFPIDVFPHDLQVFIKRTSKSFGIPIDVVATTVLTILSAVIGNSLRVSPKWDWLEPVFLWTMIIGKSGSGKTPFINKLLKPIYEIERLEHIRYEAELAKLEESKNNGTRHAQPKLRRTIIHDTTTEALAQSMYNSPRGVLLYRDELSGFVTSHNQYKQGRGSDRQQYLELWNCKSWFIDRVARGTIHVRDTGCAILGGIQDMILPSIFNRESLVDGLLPRFLISRMRLPHIHYSKFSLTNEDMEYWKRLVDKCFETVLIQDESGFNTPSIVTLDESAQDAFLDFANRNMRLSKYISDKYGVFIAKLNSYCVRVAGILHTIKDESDNISLDTLNSSIKIIRYFAGQAMDTMSRYGNEDNDLTEIEILVIDSLHTLRPQAKNGLLRVSEIRDIVNESLPDEAKQNSERISAILKKIKLLTKISAGYAHLVWEPDKINQLHTKYVATSTTSTTSTDESEGLSYTESFVDTEEF